VRRVAGPPTQARPTVVVPHFSPKAATWSWREKASEGGKGGEVVVVVGGGGGGGEKEL
jgi:hypothetical protein